MAESLSKAAKSKSGIPQDAVLGIFFPKKIKSVLSSSA